MSAETAALRRSVVETPIGTREYGVNNTGLVSDLQVECFVTLWHEYKQASAAGTLLSAVSVKRRNDPFKNYFRSLHR